MSNIRLYLDEDSMDQLLVQALRARGVDVITVLEAGTEGQLDEQQLSWAASQNRVLYSHNVADFYRLHTAFLAESRSHAGIALLSQGYSVGEQLRAILSLIATRTAEDMQHQLVFLSQYLRKT